jgi:hypothetical protein
LEGLFTNIPLIRSPHNINQHLTATSYNQLKKYTAGSILKLIKDSQLVISRRITATDENQAARQHKMTLFDDIADQLELTLD